ncbi:hypothetical protein G7Y79_00006g018600 [Physcia stellaris]|nr:hypothetical protein G7Y79_00006g018600 [Physcia stellaris]
MSDFTAVVPISFYTSNPPELTFKAVKGAPDDSAILMDDLIDVKVPRKWTTDDAVWMRKSAADIFEFKMFVKSWQYNADRPGWDYKLRDEKNVEHEDWVKETDTKEA